MNKHKFVFHWRYVKLHSSDFCTMEIVFYVVCFKNSQFSCRFLIHFRVQTPLFYFWFLTPHKSQKIFFRTHKQSKNPEKWSLITRTRTQQKRSQKKEYRQHIKRIIYCIHKKHKKADGHQCSSLEAIKSELKKEKKALVRYISHYSHFSW